eukprot:1364070-Rhodomonas_salina.3
MPPDRTERTSGRRAPEMSMLVMPSSASHDLLQRPRGQTLEQRYVFELPRRLLVSGTGLFSDDNL